MSNALTTITQKMATRFEVDSQNSKELIDILKQTCFKQKEGVVSDMQLSALMIIAQKYGLNPFVKEIYAYPDKGGIVPVVGVDGWTRIANEHSQFEGFEFRYSPETFQHKGKLVYEWIECVVYRKDRTRPVVIREYFDEVCRILNFATPWDSHPKRMHRHKAMIQAFRVAFGFSGIHDEDEAERIIEKEINPMPNGSESKPADEKTADILGNLGKKPPKANPPIDAESDLMPEVIAAIQKIDSKETQSYAKELISKLTNADDKVEANSLYKDQCDELKRKFEAKKQEEQLADQGELADWEAAIDGCSNIAELDRLESEMPDNIKKETKTMREKVRSAFNFDPYAVE
ncbi:MAG: phage recombination protein Bet [Methylobacter sp.]